jgi:hypothetical protein
MCRHANREDRRGDLRWQTVEQAACHAELRLRRTKADRRGGITRGNMAGK